MPTLPRTLRGEIAGIPGAQPWLSARGIERRDVILAAARHAMVLHGRGGVRLSDLALALGMTPATFRRYFPDLDDLLADILRAHVLAISSAIGDALRHLPPAALERQPAARAAYIAATRTVLGGHTEAHLLLVRERHQLPPDLLESIEETRNLLGHTLAGELAEAALGLLDMTQFSLAQIEAMLRLLATPARATPRLRVISRPDPQPTRSKVATGGLGAWADSTGACASPPKANAPQPYSTADP